MAADPRTETSVVVATYAARRDAEMAQDRLDQAGIDAIITADDAGGMHPQMQGPHGVKLSVLESRVETAYDTLDAAGMLPEAGPEATGADAGAASRADEWMHATSWTTLVAYALAVLILVAGLIALALA
jgi:hypothetical protein